MKKICALLVILIITFSTNILAQKAKELPKKLEQINSRPSYGSCPNCHTAFSSNDDVYHHSCLKTWIEQEFNTSLKWVNEEWNDEIDGLFKLPKVFKAIPFYVNINDYFKENLKLDVVSINVVSNELKLITKNKDEYITDVLITNPIPSPLNHIIGVKISCIGSCNTGCRVDNTDGTYYCVKCSDTTNPNMCKTNMKGDYGFDRTNESFYLAKNLFPIDETDNGERNYLLKDIKKLVKENLPKGFVPIKSQIVINGKTKNLLLQCVNGKSSLILIGSILDKQLSNQFIIIQGLRIPTKLTNLESYIKKSLKNLNKTNSNKQNYVDHLILSCENCEDLKLKK